MAGALPWLRPELAKSINDDPPAADGPKFDVVCFSPDGVRKLGDALLAPTAANRKRAADFLAKAIPSTTAGMPKLAPALSATLALKPQVIELVLDGVADADRSDDWVKAIKKAAGNEPPPIVRVLYLSDADKGDPATIAALKELARASGGTFIPVLKKDLAKGP